MNMPDIKKMTLKEKIAQLVIVRMCDLMMYADSSYTKFRDPKEAATLAEKYQYGAVWLHGNTDVNQINDCWRKNVKFNHKELKKWYEELRKNVKIPMIAVNDAGATNTDISAYPGGLGVGASVTDGIAFELGQCIAREQQLAGSDWLWTPVVDNQNKYASGINRQFSAYPKELIRCAIDYMKGYQSVNVCACAKHFPGADKNETRDSHIVTTGINMSLDEWWENQGKIFQAMIDAGVDSVMSLASIFPAADDTKVDGRYLPAGLSNKILMGLLKGKMGFKGVVVTDDVTMGGFTSFYSGGRLYAEFIKAGNDMLLGTSVDAVDLIYDEVLKGTVSEERIDDACQRVLNMKKKLGLFDKGYREPICTMEEAKEKTAAMAKKLSESAITLVRDLHSQIPFDKNKVKKVAIISYTHAEIGHAKLTHMKEAFEEYGCQVLLQRRIDSFEDAERIANEYDLIVYAGYINFHAPKGAPSFYGDEFWSLRHAFVYGKEKSVGISLGYPHIMHNFMDDAHMFVNAYSLAPEMQKAFVKGLFGDIPFVGKSPVELD
ncbi:MAG: glycoside hydrolase family 3 protein [Clostridia bacterium]|nr:glycoside hydrolase family 3 protein [Clostridia bacterium]